VPRIEHLKMAFNAGEFSPRLSARVDFDKYVNAVETLENFFPLVHGGARRRAGTRFVQPIKTESSQARLLDFEFSNTQAYAIELGPGWMRFYRNSGRIDAGDTDGAILNGTFDTDLSSWTDRDSGTGVSAHNGTNNTMELDGASGANEAERSQSVTITTDNTLLHILKFRVFNTTAAADVVTVRVGTAAGLSDILADTTRKKGWHCIEFTPNADTYHIGFQTNVLNVEIDEVSLIDNTGAEIGNDYTAAQITDIQWFQSADVMWLTEWTHKPMELTRTGHASWSLTEYAPTADPFTSALLFPRTGTMFEQRILFAATQTDSQSIFGSKTDDFQDMTVGTNDDDAFKFTIASGKINVIQWLDGIDKGLVAGTLGSEFTVNGESGLAITPTNIAIVPRTQHGSKSIRPQRVGNSLIFVQRAGRKLREFTFNFESDNFVAPDLLLLAEHLTGQQSTITQGAGLTITELVHKEEPDPTLWALRSDGRILVAIFDRTQNVIGWARHTIGGVFGTSIAVVDSITVIPHPDGDKDQVWLIVKRTIDGATRRYVEFYGEDAGSHYNDVLLDSAIVGTALGGGDSTTLTGLSTLEGETVGVMGDGAVYPNATVASNQITVTPGVTTAEVGFNYTSTLKTLRPEARTTRGTIQGLDKQRPIIKVRILDTLGIQINSQAIAWRSPDDAMDTVPPLQSRDVEIRQLGWDEAAQVTITQSLPQPAHIIAVIGSIEVE